MRKYCIICQIKVIIVTTLKNLQPISIFLLKLEIIKMPYTFQKLSTSLKLSINLSHLYHIFSIF